MNGHQYSLDEITFLKEHITGLSHVDLTRMFNERFNLSLTVNQVTAACKNRKLNNGLNGCFPKGNVPFNKGLKGWQAGGKARETQFKKGQMPTKHRPVGSERVNVDGYVEIKVSEPKVWRSKHVVIWEAAHGPVPAGHAVIFGDGNRLNITLENLLLISRKELAVLNKRHLIGGSRELTEAGRLVANLSMKITARRKHERGKSQCSTTDN